MTIKTTVDGTRALAFFLASSRLNLPQKTTSSPQRKVKPDFAVRFGFHSFRHCYATMLNNQGVNPLVVCDLMGHAATALTARYSHIAMSTKTQAINELPELSIGEPVKRGVEEIPFATLISGLPAAILPRLAAYLDGALNHEQKVELARRLV